MTLILPVGENDHARGLRSGAVTLLEYGDFQSLYCKDAFPMIQSIRRRMGDDLCVVFRHMPLAKMHPLAEMLAEAAEAAGQQGRFWEMHDALYAHPSALHADTAYAIGLALELDMPSFESDLAARRHRSRVNHDFVGGLRSGVAGAPTFFVNGVRYEGSVDEPSLFTELTRSAATRSNTNSRLLAGKS